LSLLLLPVPVPPRSPSARRRREHWPRPPPQCLSSPPIAPYDPADLPLISHSPPEYAPIASVDVRSRKGLGSRRERTDRVR